MVAYHHVAMTIAWPYSYSLW